MIPQKVCPICASRNVSVTICDAKRGIHLLTCGKCKTGWHEPTPTDEFLKSWYSENGLAKRWKGDIKNAIDVNYEQNKDNFKLYFDMLVKLGVLHGGIGVLDIGCYSGAFLSLFKPVGCKCFGIDRNAGLIKYGVEKFGLDLTQGCIEDYVANRAFDIITFHQVLEHTQSPKRFMRKVANMLSPSGIIQFSVPDASVNKKISYPEHLWHFQKESLGVLLNVSGFSGEIVQVVGISALVCIAKQRTLRSA